MDKRKILQQVAKGEMSVDDARKLFSFDDFLPTATDAALDAAIEGNRELLGIEFENWYSNKNKSHDPKRENTTTESN